MRSPNRSRLLSAFAGLGLSVWLLLPGTLSAQSVQDQLPEMGTAAQATLSLEDEYRIGRMVMRGLRDFFGLRALREEPLLREHIKGFMQEMSTDLAFIPLRK